MKVTSNNNNNNNNMYIYSKGTKYLTRSFCHFGHSDRQPTAFKVARQLLHLQQHTCGLCKTPRL